MKNYGRVKFRNYVKDLNVVLGELNAVPSTYNHIMGEFVYK